ncbi:MAG: histidine--tRNA ligase [Betaproteobacteria bacterium]|nr:histidine--tRNA ligase [Betaproteobacteria bacterium]
MNDVLPAQEGLWRYFEETVAAVVTSYGYRQIRTPILEHTGLFLRGIGEVTDIVEKEMYSFTDALNGEQLTLRPESTLDEDARRRLHSNPLRILDSKNPSMQALIEAAPRLDAFLGEASIAHFEGLQALLRRRGLGFNINPRLVRGLDYYNLSVFEWVAEIDGKPPLTVCGGGRYDGLIETLGGKAAPGCGFAIGVERILDLLQMHLPPQATACDVYLVHQATQSTLAAMDLAEQLRDHGLDVLLHCGGGSFKSQFRRADASGAAYAVVLGEDELTQGVATIKDLRDSSVSQVRVAMSDAAKHILEHGFGVQH